MTLTFDIENSRFGVLGRRFSEHFARNGFRDFTRCVKRSRQRAAEKPGLNFKKNGEGRRMPD